MEPCEYLEILSEQIRCKKARPMIVEELKAHMEDQAEAYQKEGMDEEQAMKKAVLEMGDPVEAGVALDRIHRPKMQWTLVVLVVLLSLIGMVMQIVIFKTGCLSNDENITTIRNEFISNSIWNTLISFAVIAVVCIVDYTFLVKHPVALWWGFGILQFFLARFYFFPFNSIRTYQIRYYLCSLMVPVFAAVVFQYKNKGMQGFLKCIGLYLMAILFIITGEMGFISTLVELSISVFVLLNIAVMRGWFGEKKSGKLLMLWIPTVGLPLFLIFTALYLNDRFPILAGYQAARIQAFFQPDMAANYTVTQTREIMGQVTLLGTKELPLTSLPALQNDYIITSMFTYFGALLTFIVLGMVGFFVFKALHLSVKQKNQLGSMVSIGCVTTLLAKITVYVASNLGGPIVFGQMSMPFLSYGLGNAVINGVLVGLLLCVYRNTEIVSEKSRRGKYTLKISIQKES